MEVFDFITGDDGDILFKDGDLAIGESTEHHQRDLLLAMPGDFRQHPTVGVGIRMELNNSITQDELRIALQREMERDGMVVASVVVRGEDIDIKGSYGEA